jgi:hypothetical protein
MKISMEFMLVLGRLDERRGRVNYGTFRAKGWFRPFGDQLTGTGFGRSARLRNQLMHAAIETAAAVTEMATPLAGYPCQVKSAPAVETKAQLEPMQLNWRVVMAPDSRTPNRVVP